MTKSCSTRTIGFEPEEAKHPATLPDPMFRPLFFCRYSGEKVGWGK